MLHNAKQNMKYMYMHSQLCVLFAMYSVFHVRIISRWQTLKSRKHYILMDTLVIKKNVIFNWIVFD